MVNAVQDPVNGDPDDGGSYYDPGDAEGESVNILRTGNLLQQMALVGDTNTANRTQDAINYMVRHWYDSGGSGWEGCPSYYQSAYTTMKGLEALKVDYIDSIDWFGELTAALLSEQTSDGWWPVSRRDDGEMILSTDWALLTLQKAIATVEKPDLEIIDKYEEWIDEGSGTYVVSYTVKNRGNIEVPAGHYVGLTVDSAGIEAQAIPVPLSPGESYSDTFDTVITLTDVRDEVIVCADHFNDIDELNEENNCLSNLWPIIETIVSVSPHVQTVCSGQFTVDINVEPGEPVAGVQFDLLFDPSLITADSVEEGNLLSLSGCPTFFLSGPIDNVGGTINGVAGTVLGAGCNVFTPGTFATITFIADELEGVSPLDLLNVQVIDPNGNPVPIVWYNGEVEVSLTPWDVNCDGCVDIIDLVLVGQHWGQTGPDGWIPEDVNDDGVIDIIDLVLIGQHWMEGC